MPASTKSGPLKHELVCGAWYETDKLGLGLVESENGAVIIERIFQGLQP